jgi:hypothetical protein
MKKTLTREVKFGKGKAVITVKFENPTVNLDGDYVESHKVEKMTDIKIMSGSKVVATASHADLIQDNIVYKKYMEQHGMDLNKKYTRVGKMITEGAEVHENITQAIVEMEAELSQEFEVQTEQEKEIEEAQEIIESAEKEGVEKLRTESEIRNWRKAYNNIHNEGGEGYIPTKISKERYQRAKIVLGL